MNPDASPLSTLVQGSLDMAIVPATPTSVGNIVFSWGDLTKTVHLLPVEIQARDGKINDGFDPPLSGDKDINNVRDEDDWVPWTRVAKSGTFQVNELSQLVTSSVSVAQTLEVVPRRRQH